VVWASVRNVTRQVDVVIAGLSTSGLKRSRAAVFSAAGSYLGSVSRPLQRLMYFFAGAQSLADDS